MGVKVYERPMFPVPIKWVILGVLIALASVAAGIYFFASGDEPDASSLMQEDSPAKVVWAADSPRLGCV